MGSYQSRKNRNDMSNNNGTEEQSFASTVAKKKQEEKESTKKLAKTAGKGAATYFGGPAGGQAVDIAANTKAGDKVLNKGAEALNKVPGVKKVAKKLDDKGITDKADQAISIAGGSMGGGAGAGNGINAEGAAAKGATPKTNTGTNGGSSSTTGGDSSSSLSGKKGGILDSFKNRGKNTENDNSNSDDEKDKDKKDKSFLDGKFKLPTSLKIAIISVVPLLLIIILIVAVIASYVSTISNFLDFLGISSEIGFSTGGVEYVEGSDKAQAFYKRVSEVKEEFARDNKNVDAIVITSVYHVMNYHNNKYDYDYMTKSRIKEIANHSLKYDKEGKYYTYDEDYFRDNLINKYFSKYFSSADKKTREKYAEEVFDYVQKYYKLIGYEPSACSGSGTCSYEIKGFYIYGKGNVTKNLNINNLKVRLMQSGSGNGYNYGGTFGLAMPGEGLVDFEKYILGVAYQEIGPTAPDEAIKAQMVAARSYILARSTDMGGWRTLKQENGQWILQAANSTQDQVYCDPDQGCSSTNGQWSMVYSGTGHGKTLKPALAQNARMRTLANETKGEVLVNSQGYIIYTGYKQAEQNKFTELANQGMNYKQILLQVYNSSSHKFGAADIATMNCTTSSASCARGVSGDIASWRQNQGPWVNIPLGKSYNTISTAGCLVTSIAIQMARSGVPINIPGEFNPGTFVQFLNQNGGFTSTGALTDYTLATKAAPNFKYAGSTSVMGYSQTQKSNTLVDLLNKGYYVIAEVKIGNHSGQHWVAVVSAENGQITMVDPATTATNMWGKYHYSGTSRYVYYRVG